jgi:CBS domain-containing protein
MKARDIMSVDLVTVGPGHSIAHAIQIMLDSKVSGLPVIGNDGKLIGMLTEGDLMRRFELGGGNSTSISGGNDNPTDYIRSHSWRVSDVMSRDVESVSPVFSLGRIAELMERCHIKRVPVVENKKVVGLVSRADLLRAIVSARPEPIIRGDNALRIAIMARIGTDADLEQFEVEAVVENGHVTLLGTVENESQREAARVAAESVRGCASITNKILVIKAQDKGS